MCWKSNLAARRNMSRSPSVMASGSQTSVSNDEHCSTMSEGLTSGWYAGKRAYNTTPLNNVFFFFFSLVPVLLGNYISKTQISSHNAPWSTNFQQWLGSLVTRASGKPPRPTQPPTLSGMGNEYRPKCGYVLQLQGSKGRYGSFQMWINV